MEPVTEENMLLSNNFITSNLCGMFSAAAILGGCIYNVISLLGGSSKLLLYVLHFPRHALFEMNRWVS